HPGADRPGGIEAVYVDGNVGRTIAGHSVDLPKEFVSSRRFKIVESDTGEALILPPSDVIGRETAASQSDLDHPLGIDQSLLYAAPEGRRMVDPGLGERVQGIRMRIDLHDADRTALGNRPQDRQRDCMITADRDRHRANLVDSEVEAF